MASKAIASLDQWLTEAEEVLQQSHEIALSPSQATQAQVEQSEWSVSLGSFGLGLPSLLDRLCSRPGRWILIADDAEREYRFWQAMAFEDGSLVAEAGSGTPSLPSEHLSVEEERQLAVLGWNPPELPTSPNWQRVEATISPDVDGVADQAMRTLRDVYGIGDGDRLKLTLFPSPRRGGTLASEQIPSDLVTLEEPAPRRGFRPTDEPWADYYRQIFPNSERPGSAFAAWKYATKAVEVAIACWDSREKARAEWEASCGEDCAGRPMRHPPFVVQLSQLSWAACLGCTWVVRCGSASFATAEAVAWGHVSECLACEHSNHGKDVPHDWANPAPAPGPTGPLHGRRAP